MLAIVVEVVTTLFSNRLLDRGLPSSSYIYSRSSLLVSAATLAPNHLNYYDQAATSTAFGEPVFRLEPSPSLIHYDHSRGATIMCLASGNPLPRITWYTSAADVDIGHNVALTSNLDNSNNNNGILTLNNDDQISRPVTNISGVRQIINGGTILRLLPFEKIDYRPDIHSAEYRCVATNSVATIHSRSVQVQAGE